MIDAEPWFVAADVCRVLDFQNVSKTVSRLEDDEKTFVTIPARGVSLSYTQGGEQNMLVINEPGLYRLVFASRKPEARTFRRWVYHEVLPSIRKTGKYSLVAKREPNPNRVAGQFTDACVYAALMSDGTVKIGQNHDVRRRLTNLQSQYKLSVVKTYQSPLMSRKVARLIEKACHKLFSSSKSDGEFFCVEYDHACAIIGFVRDIFRDVDRIHNRSHIDKANHRREVRLNLSAIFLRRINAASNFSSVEYFSSVPKCKL